MWSGRRPNAEQGRPINQRLQRRRQAVKNAVRATGIVYMYKMHQWLVQPPGLPIQGGADLDLDVYMSIIGGSISIRIAFLYMYTAGAGSAAPELSTGAVI